MKSREDRDIDARERALAAIRLSEDDFVSAWFEAERKLYIEDMISADVAEDERRRVAALKLRTLDALRSHIQSTATAGRKMLERNDKRDKQ